ncbi:MAG: excinuclease ATPase subunit [Candidatus Binataceae bacterium]|nr:excinuclease ATPase subunit [Candidatus Binataceae bacterium]
MLTFSYQDVVDAPDSKAKLGNEIAFYFANQPTPKVEKTFGIAVGRRKAKSASDEQSCHEAMIYALTALRDRAISDGANAVIDISSYYKKKEIADKTKYECRAGASGASVVLRGTIVKLGK